MRWLAGSRVEARERRVLAWGAAALFLASWADVSVKNVSETLFLKRIGVELIPIAFLANSVLLVGTTSLLGVLAARVDPLRLFTRALAGLGGLLALLWLLVHVGGQASYPILLIASKQISSIALITFSVATGALVDPRQAKQVLPPLLAGGTLGAILGSFASGPLGRALDVEGLLPVAALLLLLGAAATIPLRRLPAARVVLERRSAPGRGAAPPAEISLRGLWRESWLLRTLVVSAVLSGAVGPMLYFQFSYVADLATRGEGGEERLLSLYAQLRGWLAIGVLLTQIWIAPALYRRIGVPLAGVFSPLLYLLGFGGLTFRLGLPEGVAALSGATVQDQAIHDPAQRLLWLLFPEGLRARVSALVEGTAKRAGGALGNLLVLAAVGLGSVAWVGVVGLPVTLLWLWMTVRVWKGYPALVLSLAMQPRRIGSQGLGSARELVDASTVRAIARALSGDDADAARAAVEVLRDLRPDVAPGLLAEAIPSAPLATRSMLLSSLEALLEDATAKPGETSEHAIALVRLLREDPPADPRERSALVRCAGRLTNRSRIASETAAALAEAAVESEPVVRLAAEIARYRLGLGDEDPAALRRTLATSLESDDAEVRDVASRELRALLVEDPRGDPGEVGAGRPEWHERLGLLISALFRPEARAAAATALAEVAASRGRVASAAAPEMFALADDADPAVRGAVLRFIGYTRRTERAALLVERLAASQAEESAAAREGLRALGQSALDALLPELCFGKRSIRDAIVPLLRELDAEAETFEAQLRRELEGVAERLLEIAALRGNAAPILVERLEERVHEGLHTAFLLLAALHDDDRIVDLGDALRRPQSRRDRALRIEALEALLLPEERLRLIPFVEDPTLELRVVAASELLGRRPLSRERTLESLLEDPDPLTRMILAGTMHERPAEAEDAMLSEVEVLLQLRSFPLFEHLTVRQLADVARLVKQEHYGTGLDIVREGEYETSMYALIEGHVQVASKGIALSELRRGEIFGELALFDGEPRSATVTTVEPTRVLRIEGKDLLALMEELPEIAIAICRKLAQLVRQMTVRSLR